eukprot:s630_g7.t1
MNQTLKLFELSFLQSQGTNHQVAASGRPFCPSSIGRTPRSRFDLSVNVACLGMTSIHSSLRSPDRRANESVHFAGRSQLSLDLVNRTGQGA